MRTLLEQILSFLLSWMLWGLGVIIRYSNKVRNDVQIKLKWFVAELLTWILLAGSVYTLLPEGGFKVPLAIFIWYFSHTILDILDKKVPLFIEKKADKVMDMEIKEIAEVATTIAKKTKKKTSTKK